MKLNKIQYEEQMAWHSYTLATFFFSWILHIYQKIKLLLTQHEYIKKKNLNIKTLLERGII